MKKITYNNFKDKLINYLKNNLNENCNNSEIFAAITHFIHNPEFNYPFLDDNIFKKGKEFLGEVINYKFSSSNKNTISIEFNDGYRQELLPNILDIPFPSPEKSKFKFIDLFAGIGGFRIAMQNLGGRCVFSSEWDKYAQKTYEANFGEIPFGDINKFAGFDMSLEEIDNKIPDHDILCAGFPCQPFSLAGVSKKNSMGRKHGFEDITQGTLFFNIAKILKAKKPKAFFLENVKNLLNHDKKRTFKVIEEALYNLGYVFDKKVIDAAAWVPQHRERLFIIGYNPEKINVEKDKIIIPDRPEEEYKYPELKKIILKNIEGYTLGPGTWQTLIRHKNYHSTNGNGFGYSLHKFPIRKGEITRTISARYHKDGAEILIEQENDRPRKLSVKEAMQLQGYNPARFIFPVSNTQAYKQIGNSVAVPAVFETAKKIVENLL